MPLPDNEFGISVDPTPRGGWDQVPLELRESLRRHRFRFRVAHELAHTFFYMRERSLTPERYLFDSQEQEDFCDLFSRSLLVSRQKAAAIAPTPQALLRLQQEFDVSLEVAARAVASVRSDLRIALWFKERRGSLKLQWSNAKDPDRSQALLDELTYEEPGALWVPHRRQLVTVAQS